ncbi:MAG: acyltransferase, partial [bacterium]
MKNKKTIDVQKELVKEGGKVKKYQELILGQKSYIQLFKYEIITCFSKSLPGAMGLFLRGKLYAKLLGFVGKNVTFGSGVVIRHPHKIFIGDNVVIDDNCVLDAKGTDNRGIFIGDGVFIGRNTVLNCQNGDIILENGVNISANCMIFSASRVRVGEKNLFAAYCYLVGGTHNFEDPTRPVVDQGRSSQGLEIGSGGWLGAHVTIFDGVQVGKHVVIGAGSVVSKNLPDYCIAAGTPASIIKKRKVSRPSQTQPQVTISIINYNNAQVIGETIESVSGQ